jgi:hypothetical protein
MSNPFSFGKKILFIKMRRAAKEQARLVFLSITDYLAVIV